MKGLKYIGTDDAQVKWGGNADPRGVLTEGEIYQLERQDVRSFHTKVKLVGIDGWFNSVSFEEVEHIKPLNRFAIASNHLTDNYIAPVPSSFLHMPTAKERPIPEFSVLGYQRALAHDSIAITGGNMDAPL